VERPKYGQWDYFIKRKWHPPKEVNGRKVNKFTIVGFAQTLESYGNDGENIHPSADKVARDHGYRANWIKRLRSDCLALGLFRQTGWYGRIPILERAMPPDAPGSLSHLPAADPIDCPACKPLFAATELSPSGVREAHYDAIRQAS
jgi:hypothetical protein